MKKNYIILTILIVSQTIKAQTINIPDINFKNALLFTLCVDTTGDGVFNATIDTNNDTKIQVSEAEAARGLDVGVFNISSLEGIAYFKNIELLYCDYNKLTSLDITQNTKLKYLECTVNQLTSLDISKNTNLEELYFPSNGLTNIDVSQHPNLKILECAYNQLTSLDVSQNPKLTSLLTFKNKLTSLNLKNGNNVNLTSFSAKNNPDLTCIRVDNVDASSNKNDWIKDSTASYSESCGVLGTDDFENDLQITCYPNPVKDIFRIKTSNAIEINSIKVYNTLGNLVMHENSHFKQLDLTNLSRGVFLVVIKTTNNSFTKRIIKE